MLSDIRNRVEESKRLNGVFGPQAQDDLECLLDLVDRLGEALRLSQNYIKRTPCDPDITDEQCAAYAAMMNVGVSGLLKELEPTE